MSLSSQQATEQVKAQTLPLHSQLPPVMQDSLSVSPSIQSIWEAYEKQGKGDVSLLKLLLEAKRAEDQRLAALSWAYVAAVQQANAILQGHIPRRSSQASSESIPALSSCSSPSADDLFEPISPIADPSDETFIPCHAQQQLGIQLAKSEHRQQLSDKSVQWQGKSLTHAEAMQSLRQNMQDKMRAAKPCAAQCISAAAAAAPTSTAGRPRHSHLSAIHTARTSGSQKRKSLEGGVTSSRSKAAKLNPEPSSAGAEVSQALPSGLSLLLNAAEGDVDAA